MSRSSGEKSTRAMMASRISFDKSIIVFPPTVFAEFAMVVNTDRLQDGRERWRDWTAKFIMDKMKPRGRAHKERKENLQFHRPFDVLTKARVVEAQMTLSRFFVEDATDCDLDRVSVALYQERTQKAIFLNGAHSIPRPFPQPSISSSASAAFFFISFRSSKST